MSGILSGGFCGFCCVFECGYGRCCWFVVQKDCVCKGFGYYIQNVGFKLGYWKFIFDKFEMVEFLFGFLKELIGNNVDGQVF